MMNLVKNPVGDERRNHHPKVSFETDYRGDQENGTNQRFKGHHSSRRSHGCEQHVISSDYRQYNGIKRSVTIEPDAASQSGDNQRQHDADEVFHSWSPLSHGLLPQRQRPQHRLLFGDQRLHSLAGQADHFSQLLLIEHLMLCRGLHFDELFTRGHHEVHIHIRA